MCCKLLKSLREVSERCSRGLGEIYPPIGGVYLSLPSTSDGSAQKRRKKCGLN